MTRSSRLLETHRALLERFRKTMNLVGPGPLDLHYRDCAEALVGLEPQGHWVDLGSGAGFPGIVFAATFPEVSLDLVDSRQKRCVFLEQVLAEGLEPDHAPVRVLCERLEHLPPEYWDGALARALAPPEKVLDHAGRLLKPGGHLLLMLQEHQPIPVTQEYAVKRQHAYTVKGRRRLAVLFHRKEPE
jgi:16S rRNA (guanine527-N7)-methyltransferase